jgi:uncharacterized protein YjbI with pentapeptide repeats
MENPINWFQAAIDLLQAIISGVFVGLVIYWLDERRAKRDRRLADFRIATNWSHTEPRVSLKNFDLSEANLSGHKFISANLEDTTFMNSKMWATNFSEANLRKTDFRKTELVGVKFTNAVAIRADFSKAIIKSRKDPDYAYLPDFSNSSLPYAKFVSSFVEGTLFRNANLKGSDFSKATVVNCDFSDADLTGSQWKMVRKVKNCIWLNVKVDTAENFPDSLWHEIQQQNIKPKKKRKVKSRPS